MAEPYVGMIMTAAFDYAPRGFAFCDGSILQIMQNQALYALIGPKFGGDGRLTFGVPDLRGRSPLDTGSGPKLTPRAFGVQLGAESVALTIEQMPSHTHLAFALPSANQINPNNNYWGGDPSGGTFPVYGNTGTPVALAANALSTSGAGVAHNNMPPYLVVNYVIALNGNFPTRA